MDFSLQKALDHGFRFLRPMARSEQDELLDGTVYTPAELKDNFRDIRRVNQLLGGTSTILRHLPSLLRHIPDTRPAAILDLASGCADIPIAISQWAKRRGQPVAIVASDVSDAILALAEAAIGADPDIDLARYDARAISLPDRHVDIVLCSLALHHFPPDEAVQVLREMARLSRTGFILNDLRRSRPGYAAAWAAARLTTRNRLTRNDAPLSVRRAYTPHELDGMLRRAGITDATISTHPWFRMAAAWRRAEDDA